MTQAVLEGVAFAFADWPDALTARGAPHRQRSRPSAAARGRALAARSAPRAEAPAAFAAASSDVGAGPRRGPAGAICAAERTSRENLRRPAVMRWIEPDARAARASWRRSAQLYQAPVPAPDYPTIDHRGDRQHDRLLRRARPRPLRGPGQRQSAGVPLLRPRPRRPRQAHGGPAAPRRRATGTVRLARASTSSAPARSTAVASTAGDRPDGRGAAEDGRRVRVLRASSARRSTASTTATSRPRARRFAESRRQPRRDGRPRRASSRQRTGVKLLWGTANLFSQPPLHGRRRDQPRPGGVRLRRRRRCAHCLEVTHRLGGAQLRAVGRPRGLRDAAQHRHEARARPARPVPAPWSSSTSTRSASRARS